MIDLSPTQAASRITALLAATENRTLDFKRISAKHGRMIETICAFANTDGGLLVIGIGDAKDLKPGAKPETRLFGVEENPEAFDLFYRQVMQRFEPPLARVHWLRDCAGTLPRRRLRQHGVSPLGHRRILDLRMGTATRRGTHLARSVARSQAETEAADTARRTRRSRRLRLA